MNIFLSFLQSEHNYPIPAYDFWQYYLKNGIEEAGHTWVECPDADWALGLVRKSKQDHTKWKQDTWSKTIAWLKKHPPDLFLSYLYPDQVDTSAIKEIQKSGIPCVNFFCDNVRDFQKIPSAFGVFDLNWVPEYKAIKLYQNAGYKYIHLPMPVWVPTADRIIKQEKYNQATFLGSKDILRKILLEDAVRLAPDLSLAIYGSGWRKEDEQLNRAHEKYSLMDSLLNQLTFLKKHGVKAYRNKIKNRRYNYETGPGLLAKYKGRHQVEQYNSLTAQSMITLGINRYPSLHFPLSKPDTYSRLRDIEAPMLGACYLTEYTEGIEELYDIENEINVYKTPEELVNKIHNLQADPEKRKNLKINGQRRALAEHSIPNSLNIIKCSLGL